LVALVRASALAPERRPLLPSSLWVRRRVRAAFVVFSARFSALPEALAGVAFVVFSARFSALPEALAGVAVVVFSARFSALPEALAGVAFVVFLAAVFSVLALGALAAPLLPVVVLESLEAFVLARAAVFVVGSSEAPALECVAVLAAVFLALLLAVFLAVFFAIFPGKGRAFGTRDRRSMEAAAAECS
jgi:hypothetical protein